MRKFYKNEKYRISIIISVLITIGFIAVVAVNYLTYSKVIKDDIQNITKLSSSNIYSQINNELIKPIFVSLTMANDSFLIQWLDLESEDNIESLQNYLTGIEVKYDYSSVFMISESTGNYYHYNGIHKKVSEENVHDAWYYNFVESGKTYDLDVDIDEVTSEMTVFINCRIEDDQNNFLGVVGVGLQMNEVQKILATFEDAYGLEAFMIDETGLVQVHTNNKLIEHYSVLEEETIRGFMPVITSNRSSLETFRYDKNGIDGYLMTRYVEDLEWYLMVKKDTSVLRNSFDAQLAEEFIILMMVLLCVVLVSHRLIKQHEIRLSSAAKTDQLTGLMNRRGFDYKMFDALKESVAKDQTFSAFIFDIDDFKTINDSHGHLFGDRVIEQIAMHVSRAIGKDNALARWGGDEFAGFIKGNHEEAVAKMQSILDTINADKNFASNNITISIGMTVSRSIDTPDTIIARADKALYQSKNQGKNQLNELI